MTQEPTYTLFQKNQYGESVNTITGLDELAAETLAKVLSTGDAYTTTDRPWTCEIVRELTPAERAEQLAEQWIRSGKSDHITMRSPADLGAALERLALGLYSLGGQEIADVWMTLDMQVTTTSGTSEDARRRAVDLLAQAIGATAEVQAHGSYAAGSGQVKVYTAISKPTTTEPEPKPLVISDDTIRQAKWIGARYPDGVNYVEPEHKRDPDESNAACACGEVFDDEAALYQHIDSHPIGEPQPIPAERVEEILAELNRLTKNPDANGREPDWWDWIADEVPEFDGEATSASTDTGELHLVDGTVLKWRGAPDMWKRATDWPVIS